MPTISKPPYRQSKEKTVSEPLNTQHQKRLLAHFFLINYLLVLLITKDSIAFTTAHSEGLGALAFLVVAFVETLAQCRVDTHHVEEIRSDLGAAKLDRLVTTGQHHA